MGYLLLEGGATTIALQRSGDFSRDAFMILDNQTSSGSIDLRRESTALSMIYRVLLAAHG